MKTLRYVKMTAMANVFQHFSAVKVSKLRCYPSLFPLKSLCFEVTRKRSS